MEIQAQFTHEKIDHSADTALHLVLSLVAPKLEWVEQRQKLCILPVIDLSGSMRGPKLEYAKKSILKLIDHLRPGDVAGLFGFESRAHVFVPPEEVTPAFKETLKSAVGKLRVLGGTNFSEGLLEAVKAVKNLDLPLNFVQRVIMFTDGQPTEGVTDPKAILQMMEMSLGNVTVSAFGYGSVGGGVYDGCDQGFLTDLARKANGNYAYVRDPDAALAAFGKELGGLLSAYATDIHIDVEPVNGHQVTKIVSDVEAEEEDVTGQVEIKLSDLLSEETRHLVLSTKLLKQAQAFPRQATVFNIKVTYSVLGADGKKETKTADVKAKVQFVKANEAQKEPDKAIDAIVGLAQMVRAQIEAEEKAKTGDYTSAAGIMQRMATNLSDRGHQGLQRVATNVSSRLGSEALYTGNRAYLASVQSGGTRAYAVSSMDAQAQHDLMGADVAMSNSLMDHMVQSFTEVPALSPNESVNGLIGGDALWVQPPPAVTMTSSLPVVTPEPIGSKRKIKQSKSKIRW